MQRSSFCQHLSIAFIVLFLFGTNAQSQQMKDYSHQIFPVNHALNTPIDSLPVHPNSGNFVAMIGANTALHPDFGTFYEGSPIGIPYNLVGAHQPRVPFTFEYSDESDTGSYPIPIPPYMEGVFTFTSDTDGDRHVLVIDTVSQKLYETWYTWPPGHSMPEPGDWESFPPANPASWWAGGGAIFDFTSNALRPDGATSADAAGLPIFPLLIRYDEVERAMASDSILHHAIRMTVQVSQGAYIWPARHQASSSTDPNRAPMGLRFRLKAAVDISDYSYRMRVILRTLKKYGLIVADNGGNWFFQGSHDERWNDNELNTLKNLRGKDFEAVDVSPWMQRPGFDINSAAVPSGSSVGIPAVQNAPASFLLEQNFPNPFNPSTTIHYDIPELSRVSLIVYDVLGRQTAVLFNGIKPAGHYQVTFKADHLSSGVYICRLQANGLTQTRKLVLLK